MIFQTIANKFSLKRIKTSTINPDRFYPEPTEIAKYNGLTFKKMQEKTLISMSKSNSGIIPFN